MSQSSNDYTPEDLAILARFGSRIMVELAGDFADYKLLCDRVRHYDTHNYRAGIHHDGCICRWCRQ